MIVKLVLTIIIIRLTITMINTKNILFLYRLKYIIHTYVTLNLFKLYYN